MPNNLHAIPIGTFLLDFRIEAVLGQGGFGITYLALDTLLNCQVAIKEYFPREFSVRDSTQRVRASGSQEEKDIFSWGLKRFLEEARTLALFDDPNIIGVRRFFEANGTAYLVMDYCDGESLDEIIKRDGPITQVRINKILFPLLDSLERIHTSNFLHRDIKPANIFIRSDGSPVLLDFGSARQQISGHSRSVTSLATVGYGPLEQFSENTKQGPWTDIYGLAATLYRAITGKRPTGSLDRVLEDNLTPLSIANDIAYDRNFLAAINAGMIVRPEGRPQSISKWRAMFKAENDIDTHATKNLEDKKLINPQIHEVGFYQKKEYQIGKFLWVYITIGVVILTCIFIYKGWFEKGFSVKAPSNEIQSNYSPTQIPEPVKPIKNILPTPLAKTPGSEPLPNPLAKTPGSENLPNPLADPPTSTWREKVDVVRARIQAGTIDQYQIRTIIAANNIAELKNYTSPGYSEISRAEVKKMESNNSWWYTNRSKTSQGSTFNIRLINPTNKFIDMVLLAAYSSCEKRDNRKLILLNIPPMKPYSEAVYYGELPTGSIDSTYRCADVEAAYITVSSNDGNAPASGASKNLTEQRVSKEMVGKIKARFKKTFERVGMSGVSVDIQACYSSAAASAQEVETLRGCILYDISSKMLDREFSAAIEASGKKNPGPATLFLSDEAYKERINKYTHIAFPGFSGGQVSKYYGNAPDSVIE